MKSSPHERKKTLRLKIEENNRMNIIGISSHENDYRLVWSINDTTRMQFIRIDNLIHHNIKLETVMEFSRYFFHDEGRYLKYYLISNRCPEGYLFPEIKNLDYLLQIVGEVTPEEVLDLSGKMKVVPVVSAAYILHAEKIKGLVNVLSEM